MTGAAVSSSLTTTLCASFEESASVGRSLSASVALIVMV
jgi:hypothetical protein